MFIKYLTRKNIYTTLALAAYIAFTYTLSKFGIGGWEIVTAALVLWLFIFMGYLTLAAKITLYILLKLSVGTTFFIFLSDQYCKIPEYQSLDTGSAQILGSFAVIGLIFYFSLHLWTALLGTPKKNGDKAGAVIKLIRDDKEGVGYKATNLLLFVTALGFMLAIIIHTILPIIYNLCIFHI